MEKILEEIRKKTEGKEKTVFVHGKFNILHPGHLRLLKFAKESGDCLVVGIYSNNHDKALLDEQLRLENILSSLYVDHAFVMDESPETLIGKFRPDIVVKGKEHENRLNPEEAVIKKYGGKLIFSSGEVSFSSLELIQREFHRADVSTVIKPDGYPERHGFRMEALAQVVRAFPTLKVVVIGDTIVDEYITCDPLGMSQEDPTIVVSPVESDLFVGGAGIVSAHARGLGADVAFFSVLGTKGPNAFVKEKLENYGVRTFLYEDETRPTTLKQRFRANGKTLLRVNHLKQHKINRELQEEIYREIRNELENADLLIFSDFNYGCLPQDLVERITTYCREQKVRIAADSQCSSQIGDVSRFTGAELLTPTEHEARIALQDQESGLVVLAEKLKQKARANNLFITLGGEGVLIHADSDANKDGFETDRLPAMNSAPKDVSGAGDSLMTCASMAFSAGADIWQGAYLGSLAAACQVGRVGNTPLSPSDLLDELAR